MKTDITPRSRRYKLAKQSLKRLISKHNKHGKDGKYNGKKTREKRKQVLFKLIKDLHALGYEIENVKLLKQKHFLIIFDMWLSAPRGASTRQTTLSNFRRLCEWINKPGLVDETLDNYINKDELDLLLKREGKNDRKIKSFSGNDVRVLEAIERVNNVDHRVACQMALMYIFGLRRQEAAMFRPVNDANNDMSINVIKGAKGGRPRYHIEPIYPEHDVTDFLDYLKRYVKEQSNVSLIPKHLTADQWEGHVSRVMIKAGLTKDQLGVTLHGLRHEFAQLKFFAKTCKIPRLLMEKGLSQSSLNHEKEQKLVISLLLGHGRPEICEHYGI